MDEEKLKHLEPSSKEPADYRERRPVRGDRVVVPGKPKEQTRKERRRKAKHERSATSQANAATTAATVLMRQNAILGRILATVLMRSKEEGAIQIYDDGNVGIDLSKLDVDEGRHLSFVVSKKEAGESLRVFTVEPAGPVQMSLKDMVRTLSIGNGA